MKIRNNVLDYVMEGLCAAMILGLILYLIIRWGAIPQEIPMNYNFSGEITRWGSKKEIFLLVGILFVVYIPMTLVERFPRIWNVGVNVTAENRQWVYRIVKYLLGTMKVLMVGMFVSIIVFSTWAEPMPVWVPVVGLGLVGADLVFWLILLWRAR